MRALLVSAPKSVLGFDRFVRLPNLGLTSIAANTDKELCEVKVLDLHVVNKNRPKFLRKVIELYKPDIVGFSAMIFQYQVSVEMAKMVRQHYPDLCLILGGYYATIDYEKIIHSEEGKLFDFIIYGEGERPFNELIKALSNGHDFSQVPNLVYRENGEVKINPRGELLTLAELKPPDRSSRWVKKGFHFFGIPADEIETSRGCIFDCNFCSIREMYGKTFRKYSIERVVEDLRDAREHGAKSVFFIDDNITQDGKRYKKLCEEIIRNGLNDLKHIVQVNVKGLRNTPGLIPAMAKSGCIAVVIGIENVLDENLSGMQKSNQFKSHEVEEVVRELKRNKIMTIGSFILGLPDDTKESLYANFDYAKKIGLDMPLLNILTPHPKTEMREKLLEMGLITNPDDYSKYDLFGANIRTKYLSPEEIEEIRHKLDRRYPLESGNAFRLVRKYPWFIMKLVWQKVTSEPIDMLRYFKSLFGIK
jgi:radical SAM superfamily enzyme YgiQ (UPF0313 family)